MVPLAGEASGTGRSATLRVLLIRRRRSTSRIRWRKRDQTCTESLISGVGPMMRTWRGSRRSTPSATYPLSTRSPGPCVPTCLRLMRAGARPICTVFGGIYFADEANYVKASATPQWEVMFALGAELIEKYGLGLRFANVTG